MAKINLYHKRENKKQRQLEKPEAVNNKLICEGNYPGSQMRKLHTLFQSYKAFQSVRKF